MGGNMVDRSTVEYWQLLFPEGYGAAMVREIAKKVVKKASSLQALRRRAGSAQPLASLLAVTQPDVSGAFGVEASVRRADGACFLVQARVNAKGDIEAYAGEEL